MQSQKPSEQLQDGKQNRSSNQGWVRKIRNHRYWRGFKNLWRYYRGWKWLIFIGLSLAFFLSSTLVFIAKTTDVDTLGDALQNQTTVYDVNDQYAGNLIGQKGSYVTLEEISDSMLTALVATEDKRFYDHNGFDTVGIGRALTRLLINRDTSGGGGSTITQQLAKNAFLTLDQTFQRKFKELFLALEIEKAYEKDQILEMYLNNAYFGNGVWGIEDASLKYFGHSAISLNWNESIILTGMLKGPSIFNPIDDYQAAMDRRNVIVDLLAEDGIISYTTAEELKQSEIYLADAFYVEESGHEYPSYFDAVINEAVALTGIPEADLMSKGYTIYTNLDPAAQQLLDLAYVNNAWLFNDAIADEPLVQSASAVVDPESGGVMAVYGGRGEYHYRGFNRATDMYRAPGSIIKPLAVYVPALEAGYNLHSMVPDIVQGYGPNDYTPENYNHYTEPSGEVPLYYALAQSKNTSAVFLMDELGVNTAVDKLRQFGITVPSQDRQLTLALGAFATGVSPVQIANAYSAFANDGIRHESYFIRRIEDASGKTVYNNRRPAKNMVMTPRIAADMTSMMLDSYGGYGTGYGAGPDYGLIAGKTGSTEVSDGSEETRDRWMVGYTPDFVIATWIGLDDVESGNLDELMPSGLGQLFNAQTTNLMSISAQNSFDVTYASQMESSTNNISTNFWEEGMSEGISQEWDQFTQTAGQWIDQAEEGLADLYQKALQGVQDFEWPF